MLYDAFGCPAALAGLASKVSYDLGRIERITIVNLFHRRTLERFSTSVVLEPTGEDRGESGGFGPLEEEARYAEKFERTNAEAETTLNPTLD